MFVLLNLHILVNFQPSPSESQGFRYGSMDGPLIKKEGPHVQIGKSMKEASMSIDKLNNKSQFIIEPNFFNRSDDVVSSPVDYENLTQIQNEILRINKEQKIHNLYRYGLKLNQESVVIIVQVHDRLEYLKILLDSLKEAKKIETSLLIISHDVYNEALTKLVRDIDFCAVSFFLDLSLIDKLFDKT